MSEATANTNDSLVGDMLDALLERQPGDYLAAFDLALDEGASLELLGNVAKYCVGRESEWGDDVEAAPGWYNITGLPYVSKLLEAEFTPDQVRDFVKVQCCGDGDHFKGFLADTSVQELFGTPQELTELMKGVAEKHSSRVLTRFDWVLEQFTVRHTTHSTGNVLGRAWEDLMSVMEVVVKHLTGVRFFSDLESLKRLPRAMQVRTMQRLYPNYISLVYMGYVLAKHRPRQEERREVERKIAEAVRRHSGVCHGALVYRWLLEGVRQAGELKNWDEFNHVRESFGTFRPLNWQCLPLQESKPGMFYVELPGRGKKVVVMVPEQRTRDDVYALGAMVLVPSAPELAEHLKPVFADDTMVAYRLELHPDAPPTAAMLENSFEFFRPR